MVSISLSVIFILIWVLHTFLFCAIPKLSFVSYLGGSHLVWWLADHCKWFLFSVGCLILLAITQVSLVNNLGASYSVMFSWPWLGRLILPRCFIFLVLCQTKLNFINDYTLWAKLLKRKKMTSILISYHHFFLQDTHYWKAKVRLYIKIKYLQAFYQQKYQIAFYIKSDHLN